MHARNFSIRAGTYFVLTGIQLDMHNDYGFTGFSYDEPKHALRLTWHRLTRTAVTVDQPGLVTLEIREVTSLEVRPRGADPAFTQDDCLNDVTYLADEDWGPTAFHTAGDPDPAWRWRFGFTSGSSIVVAARTATLRLGAPS